MENKQGLSTVKWVILLAALVAAGVHLYLNVLLGKFSVLFTLNAIGFIGLAAAYLLPIGFVRPFKPLLRWGMMGYALLTIVLWVVMNGNRDVFGFTAKGAEVALIVALLLDRS